MARTVAGGSVSGVTVNCIPRALHQRVSVGGEAIRAKLSSLPMCPSVSPAASFRSIWSSPSAMRLRRRCSTNARYSSKVWPAYPFSCGSVQGSGTGPRFWIGSLRDPQQPIAEHRRLKTRPAEPSTRHPLPSAAFIHLRNSMPKRYGRPFAGDR